MQAQENQVNIAEKTPFIYQQEEQPSNGNVLCVQSQAQKMGMGRACTCLGSTWDGDDV